LREHLAREYIADLDPDSAIRDIETVHEFVKFLVSRLVSGIQADMQRLLDERLLGCRVDVLKFGLILPRGIMDVIE
jgi:hypothetical protein